VQLSDSEGGKLTVMLKHLSHFLSRFIGATERLSFSWNALSVFDKRRKPSIYLSVFGIKKYALGKIWEKLGQRLG